MTTPVPKPVVLTILDGWGIRNKAEANAVALARTPNFDRIWRDCPHATLSPSGEDVGLPAGQMGNSEVGHTNIGAGRVVWMDLPKIDKAIEDGSFGNTPAFDVFAEKLHASGGAAHVIGLMSPGGVHSHHSHFARTARQLARRGLRVKLHLFLDGRDVPPRSALPQVSEFIEQLGDAGEISTLMGRFYAMDRDKRWDRVGKAFAAMVAGTGHAAPSAAEAIESAYANGETDEFVSPAIISGYEGMADGDGLVCINFRADRAREILLALLDPAFDAFDVTARPAFSAALGMVEYSDRLNELMEVIFPARQITNTLGRWVSNHGRRQLRLAETEKYPHVTFFLNGGVETPDQGEDRYMAPSPKVRTYDLKPEMSAAEVSERLVSAIRDAYDLIVVNYANPDMVGHTGDLNSAISACEAVDQGLGKAIDALNEVGGAMIVTADHGNCEMMIDPETGGPHTAHTTNPVPVILIGGPENADLRSGRLADLAPTLLELMGLPQPEEMTGQSLLVEVPSP